jgi:hypothetical protein
MLPPGHIAAGFLTAEALLKLTHPSLTAAQSNQLLWWGMFFGFVPDLDSFVTFAREKAFFLTNQKNNHRKMFTHAPLLWLAAGMLVVLFAPTTYWRYVGLLLWLGSWSHFLLDSIQYGIMWLWPFSPRIYSLFDRESVFQIKERKFFSYWTTFVKTYVRQISFYLEIIIIISAFAVYFK